MERRHSIRQRLLFMQYGLCAILSVVFCVAILYAKLKSEDRAMRKQLLAIHQTPLANDSPDGRLLVSQPVDSMHSDIRELLPESPEGFHEIELHDREIHVYVADGRYSAIQYVEDESEETYTVVSILLLGALGSVVISAALGHYAVVKFTEPLLRLSSLVRSGSQSQLNSGWVNQFDNDEIGDLANEIQSYIEQKDQTLRRELNFIQDASHELRTPITVIQGAIDLLDDSVACEDEAARQSRLDRIRRSVQRMRFSVESLLSLARAERQLWKKDRPCFEELLEEAIEAHRARLANKVELRLNIESDLNTDELPPLLIVAIDNLARNAVEATEEGYIEINVSGYRIQVKDTGLGLSEEAALALQHPETRPEEQATNGRIGISIVHRICQRIGWSLQIESVLSQGSLFSLVKNATEALKASTETALK